MAAFTGTEADDTFTATSGVDTFSFGENQGVDLIFKFNPSQDKLAYTDRSVDGFDDLEITRLQNGDAVIESNDQYTVLQGVDPDSLVDANFVFTTSGPRGDISDARSPARRPPDEVDVRSIQRRERAAGYPTGTAPSGGSSPGGRASGVRGVLGSLGGLFGSRSAQPAGDSGTGGARTLAVTSPGQTIAPGGSGTVLNHGQPDTTFVFDPGHGTTAVHGFRVGGTDHDTLSLPRSDFAGIADVLRHTRATASGLAIDDPATGDVVRLTGVSKAELAQNRRDIAFHA